ncbi:hypothetical protein [Halomonas sp. WWR20]
MSHPALFTHTNPKRVVILDSTDPVGPAEGRFKIDFLKRCHVARPTLGHACSDP